MGYYVRKIKKFRDYSRGKQSVHLICTLYSLFFLSAAIYAIYILKINQDRSTAPSSESMNCCAVRPDIPP